MSNLQIFNKLSDQFTFNFEPKNANQQLFIEKYKPSLLKLRLLVFKHSMGQLLLLLITNI